MKVMFEIQERLICLGIFIPDIAAAGSELAHLISTKPPDITEITRRIEHFLFEPMFHHFFLLPSFLKMNSLQRYKIQRLQMIPYGSFLMSS